MDAILIYVVGHAKLSQHPRFTYPFKTFLFHHNIPVSTGTDCRRTSALQRVPVAHGGWGGGGGGGTFVLHNKAACHFEFKLVTGFGAAKPIFQPLKY